MDKILFLQGFVSAFCANWCAQRYDECCAKGDHDVLSHPPVEDALFMAEAAWRELQKVGISNDGI